MTRDRLPSPKRTAASFLTSWTHTLAAPILDCDSVLNPPFLESPAVRSVTVPVDEAWRTTPCPRQESALEVKLRAELAQSLHQTRQEFVAAGLEYALRRFGIRDTAFQEGFAVLIFQDRAWELPDDPETPTEDASAGGS